MASAYSHLDNFNQPLYTPDFASISTALAYKQDKLDTNRDALDKYNNDLIKSIDVLKDEDKAYANERIEAVTNLVNQYAGQDLSNDGLFKALKTDYSQILDENVKNATYSTAVYRAEQSQWKKLKEEHFDKYSDINYAYSQQNANKYLSDGQVGSKYKGGGGVIEYVDVQGKLNEALPKYLKDKGMYVAYDDQSNPYYAIITTGQRVSENDVMEGLNVMLDSKDRAQLGINAWGQYSNADEGLIKSEYLNRNNKKAQLVDSQIKQLDSELLSTKYSEAEKEVLRAQLGQLKTNKENLTSSMSNLPGKESMYNTLYMEDFSKTFTSAYSMNNVTKVDREKNEEQFMALKLSHDRLLAKEASDYKIEEAIVNAQLKAAENTTSKTTNSGTGAGDGTGVSAGDNLDPNRSIFTETDASRVIDPYSKLQDEFQTYQQNLSKKGLFTGLNPGASEEMQNRSMAELENFSGRRVPNSYNPETGTYLYIVGDLNGKPVSKPMTEEDAQTTMLMKQNLNQLTYANQQIFSTIDNAVEESSSAFLAADDFNYDSLPDYNMTVIAGKNGGKDKIVSKVGTNGLSYSELFKKAKTNSAAMTADEKATFKLYNMFSTVVGMQDATTGTFGGETGTSESAYDVAEMYLKKKQNDYENGDRFIPENITNLRQKEGTITTYPINPFTVIGKATGLFTNQEKALDVISQHYWDGKYYVNTAPQYGRRNDNISIPADVLKVIERMPKENPDSYVFTPIDDQIMNSFFQKNAVSNKRTGGYDNSFSSADASDLDIDVEGSIFDKATNLPGGNFNNYMNDYVMTDIRSQGLNQLGSFQKANQDYSRVYEPDKIGVRKELNSFLIEQANPLQIDPKGEVHTSTANGKTKLYGQMIGKDAEGKEVTTTLRKDQGIIIPEEVATKLGIVENKQLTTAFDLENKNPAKQSFKLYTDPNTATVAKTSLTNYLTNNYGKDAVAMVNIDQALNTIFKQKLQGNLTYNATSYNITLDLPTFNGDSWGTQSIVIQNLNTSRMSPETAMQNINNVPDMSELMENPYTANLLLPYLETELMKMGALAINKNQQ